MRADSCTTSETVPRSPASATPVTGDIPGFFNVILTKTALAKSERMAAIVIGTLAVVVGLLIVFGVAFAANAMFGAPGVFVTVFTAIASPAVAIWRWRADTTTSIRRALGRLELPLSAEGVAAALDHSQVIHRATLHAELARWLAAHGLLECVVCLRHAERLASFEPLAVPFEPRELAEQWLDPSLCGPDPSEASSRARSDTTAAGFFKPARSRGRPAVSGLFLLTGLIPVGVVLLSLSYLNGGKPPGLWPAITAGVAVAILQGALTPLRAKWWLAPGTILIRSQRWFGGEWKQFLHRRGSSAMVVWDAPPNGIAVAAVSDGERTDVLPVTNAEIRFLLRAWLSPIEPPPRELLLQLP